jgi:hypothetical protein
MNQIQLSETQIIILSAACSREHRLVFPVTAKIKGGAVGNCLKSLLKRGLIEEIQATDLNAVWRHDEELGSITLRATPLACSALGLTDEATAPSQSAPVIERSKGGKQALLIKMLGRPEGATIQQVVDATGWLPHTVRGMISGTLRKKLGLEVTSERVEGRGRVYRIAS